MPLAMHALLQQSRILSQSHDSRDFIAIKKTTSVFLTLRDVGYRKNPVELVGGLTQMKRCGISLYGLCKDFTKCGVPTFASVLRLIVHDVCCKGVLPAKVFGSGAASD